MKNYSLKFISAMVSIIMLITLIMPMASGIVYAAQENETNNEIVEETQEKNETENVTEEEVKEEVKEEPKEEEKEEVKEEPKEEEKEEVKEEPKEEEKAEEESTEKEEVDENKIEEEKPEEVKEEIEEEKTEPEQQELNEVVEEKSGLENLMKGNSVQEILRGNEDEEEVQSIEFIPATPYRWMENTHGYETTKNVYNEETGNYESVDIYIYDVYIENGDKLIVTNTEGNSTEYVYGYREEDYTYGFFSEDGKVINSSEVYFNSEQYDNPWEVGTHDYITVEYKGISTTVSVTILENEVDSIQFIPSTPYRFIENTHGYEASTTIYNEETGENEDVDFWYYNVYYYNDGDKLIVTDKSGNSTEYVYGFGADENDNYSYGFFSEDRKYIDQSNVSFYYDQYSKPWEIGTHDYITVKYMRKTTKVPVTIVENPVASIEYIPAKPYKYTENINGYVETRTVYDEEAGTSEDVEYFRYNIPGRMIGDKLVVTDKSENSKEYVYGYRTDEDDNNQWGFFSEDDDFIDENDVTFLDRQYDNPWIVGTNNYLLVTYLGFTTNIQVTILENQVESIEFTPAKPYEFIENHGGYRSTISTWDPDLEEYIIEDEYYCYQPNYNLTGNKLTITYKNGSTVDYIYGYREVDGEDVYGYYNENDEFIDPSDMSFSDDQRDNHWTVGTNYAELEYMNRKTQVPVTILENPVASIQYIPVTPYEYIENTGGELREREVLNERTGEYETEEYYYYYLNILRNGDKLIVNYKNGSSEVYTYGPQSSEDAYNCEFYSIDGKYIPSEEYSFRDNQATSHWTLGSNNYIEFEYMDRTTQVQVTILENPIASIEFIPSKPYTCIENVNGDFDTREVWNEELGYYEYVDYFRYTLSYYNEGDKLIVTDKNGVSTEYVYEQRKNENNYWIYAFYSANGDSIEYDDIDFDAYQNQKQKPWVLGSNNYTTIEYMGCTAQVQITIVENQVESIEFVPKTPYTLIEDIGGNVDTREVWNEETEDYDYIDFFYYDLEYYKEGDKLIITDKNGSTKEYVYEEREDQNHYLVKNFYSSDGDCINKDDINFITNQYETPWTLGSNNYATIEYMKRTTQLQITVVENPVASIEFIPNEPYTCVENANGSITIRGALNEETGYYEDEDFYYYNLNYYNEGDKLLVTDKNGDTTEYVYKHKINKEYEHIYGFYSADGGFIDEDDVDFKENCQFETPWTLGTNNYVIIEYMGKTARTQVTVVENQVESIEFVPKTPYTFYENAGGSLNTRRIWNSQTHQYEELEYYSYGIDLYREGNKLLVTYKNGNTVEYVYEEREVEYNNWRYGYYNADGDRIESNDLDFNTNQYETPWTLGANNYVTVEYSGHTTQIPVTILENPVESIAYASIEPYRSPENTNGHFREGTTWNEETNTSETERYFIYRYNAKEEGNKLIVTYKNGNTIEYTYGYRLNEENYPVYGYYSQNNGYISTDEVHIYDDQDENHWTLGTNNYFTIEYMGKKIQIQFEIIDNQVESIAFTPNKPYTFPQNANGYWETTEVWDEEKQELVEEEYYEYNFDYFKEGDKLTVTYKDGTTMEYTFEWMAVTEIDYDGKEYQYKEGVFKNNNYIIYEYDVTANTNQDKTHWTFGPNNYMTVIYAGHETQVPVEVVENQITSIEYIPVNNYEIVENTNGYMNSRRVWDEEEQSYVYEDYYHYEMRLYNTGDRLIVHFKDGSSKEYICRVIAGEGYDYGDYEYYTEAGEKLTEGYVDINSYQYDNPYEIGKENFVTVEYMGRTVKIPVTITTCEHEYTEVINKATTTKDGSIVKRCSKCNSEQVVRIIPYPKTVTLSATSYTYDGTAKKPTVTVKGSDGKVIDASNYDVSYTNNINPGTAKVTITFKGDYYEGTITKEFTITAKSITGATVSGIANQIYTGKNITPNVTVKDGATVLTKGTDYTVAYTNNLNTGKATVTIKGTGIYTGTITKYFFIVPKQVTGVANKTQDTSSITLKWTATAGATGYQVFKYDTSKKQFVSVSYVTTTTYKVAKLSAGTTYKFYVRAYKDVSGTKYYGANSATVSLTTLPKKPTLKSVSAGSKKFTAKWAKISGASGYEIQYSLKSSFKSAKTAKVKKGSTVSQTVKKLKSKKKYYVRIRAYKTLNGKTYYSSWSGKKTVTTKK